MKYIFNKDNFLLLEFLDNAKKILDEKGIDINDQRFQKIKSMTNKNPAYVGLFTHYIFVTDEDISEVERVFNLIKKYSQLLKNVGIVPTDIISSKEYLKISQYSSKANKFIKDDKVYRYFFLEELEDVIQDVIVENEKSKFVKKFISNKYKHLVNDRTKELFYELKKIGEKLGWKSLHSKIQSLLTDKLIVFKNPDDLNLALEKTIDQIKGGWDTDSISKEVEEIGAGVVYKDDRFVIVDIYEDKNVLCELGSQKWCIVYSTTYFKDYVQFPNKQYIIYDTYLDRTDNKSMIGVTIEFDKSEVGKFRTAHDREDSFVSEKYLKDLGVRKYLKRMSIDEIKSNSENITFLDKIKYHLNDELIDDLESGKIDTETYEDTIIKTMIKYNNLEAFKYFYGNFEPNINKNDYISLSTKYSEFLEYILNNINQDIIDNIGSTAMLTSISKNRIKSVKILFKYGVSPNIKLYNTVTLSVIGADIEMVKLLVENGAEPERNNNKAIHRAYSDGKKEIVEYLYNIDSVKNTLSERDRKSIGNYINKNK